MVKRYGQRLLRNSTPPEPMPSSATKWRKTWPKTCGGQATRDADTSLEILQRASRSPTSGIRCADATRVTGKSGSPCEISRARRVLRRILQTPSTIRWARR